MRVLFTAHGALGHVLPLTPAARVLVDAGHDVLFATAPQLCPAVGERGLAAAAAGLNDDLAVAEARRRWPKAAAAPAATWTPRMFCEIAAPAMVADLARIVDRWRPDVVVREEGEHGGPAAAAAAGLPWLTHGWGSPLPEPAALDGLRPLLAPAWAQAGMSVPEGVAIYGAAVLDPCPPSLYGQVPALPNRHAIRPGALVTKSDERADSGRRAYVGLGTVPLFNDAPDLLHAAVDALLELDFDVTVTTGRQEVAGKLKRLERRRVTAAPWVDLADVLASCTVAVCHGGAGTVLAALAAGVPLLVVPRGAPSQARMAEACQARGAARAVDWTGANLHEFRDALAAVASSEPMRAAAAELAGEIAAMPPPTRVEAVLQAAITCR